MTTAHPVVRFPIFLMGILGGLQVLRAHKNWDIFEDPNVNKNLLHTVFPWGYGNLICSTKKTSKVNNNIKIPKDKCSDIWRKRTKWGSCKFEIIICIEK